MKRSALWLAILGMLSTSMVYSSGADEPVQDIPTEAKPLEHFMRRKLDLSREALEGIVTENFSKIKRAADGLEKMSRQAEWDVFNLTEYNHFSAEFRRIARTMARHAEKSNIDGASMAYVQLTLSCVECHKYTRGIRMANAASDR